MDHPEYVNWSPSEKGFRKKCPVCDSVFYGRRNRTYCSSVCKARLNNDKASERLREERKLTGSLLTNQKILAEIWNAQGLEEARVSGNRLIELGFDPKSPNSRGTINGSTWYMVGGYAYRPVESERLVLIRKSDSL